MNLPLKKVHTKFCKMLLGVKKQTSSLATRAECGCYPLHLDIYTSMVKYWLRLERAPSDKLISKALACNISIQEAGLFTWTSMIKYILKESNFLDVWHNKVTNINASNEKVVYITSNRDCKIHISQWFNAQCITIL